MTTSFDPTKTGTAGAVSAIGAYVHNGPDGFLMVDDSIRSLSDIPGLALLWDVRTGSVDASDAPCVDGGSVARVLDSSGNARHGAVQGGSPIYQATGGFGGNPGIRGGRIVSPAFVDSTFNNAITVYQVAKSDTGANSTRIKCSIVSSPSSNFWSGWNGTTATRDSAIAGLTGLATGGAPLSAATPVPEGFDCLGIGTGEVTVFAGGFGLGAGGSVSSMVKTGIGGSTAFAAGVLCAGGLSGNASFDWLGTWSLTAVFLGYHTEKQKRQVLTLLSSQYPSATLVTILGNSLTAGTGSTSGATQMTRASGDNLPGYLQASLGTAARLVTDAYPGRTGAQIVTESPSYSGVFGQPKTVSVVWELTNTLGTTGSPQKAVQDIWRICSMRRKLGAKVVVLDCMLRGDSGNDARNAALTAEVNRLVKKDWTLYADAYVPLSADSRLQNFNNATYFDTDKTHLKSAGYQVVASLVAAVVQPLL
jgi:lysophospholipase L1-like esterase